MALTPAIRLDFDGALPHALDGTADASGFFHLPVIKQGSTVEFVLNHTNPSLGSVEDYFWICHFRTPQGNTTAEFAARWRVAGQTDTETSYIIPDPNNPTTGVLIHFDHEASAAIALSAGTWDIEAMKWNTIGDFGAGYAHVDRIWEGNYQVSAETTRQSGATIPGVGV